MEKGWMSRILLPLAFGLFLVSAASAETGKEKETGEESSVKKPAVIDKVERSFGARFFNMKGYVDFIEPRVAFIKRKPDFSEVIEYSWRPMLIHDMPHKERIDRIQCSFNRYYYIDKQKKVFVGAGVGGNIVLFSEKLKDWARTNAKVNLRDGINGLGRVMAGYKIRDIPFGKWKFPLVVRADAFFSPPYRFGAALGDAGEKLKLTEAKIGLALSVE